MGDRLFRKSLVIGIIVLFIGVAVQPGISTNTVQDEKSNVDAKKIEQLSDFPCDCKKDNITGWYPPGICYILLILFVIGYAYNLPIAGWAYYLMELLDCPYLTVPLH